MDSSGTTTYTYSADGNLTGVREPTNSARTTMTYDKENRLKRHEYKDSTMFTAKVATYQYDGDGLKRTEEVFDGAGSAVLTTLVWDGDEYLQGRT